MVADEKPSRLAALDPRTGRELAVLRTSANALAVGPHGHDHRRGAGDRVRPLRRVPEARPPDRPATVGIPAGRPGPGGPNNGDCGPKGELCPDPDGGKDG